jgi:hypothetical protein
MTVGVGFDRRANQGVLRDGLTDCVEVMPEVGKMDPRQGLVDMNPPWVNRGKFLPSDKILSNAIPFAKLRSRLNRGFPYAPVIFGDEKIFYLRGQKKSQEFPIFLEKASQMF